MYGDCVIFTTVNIMDVGSSLVLCKHFNFFLPIIMSKILQYYLKLELHRNYLYSVLYITPMYRITSRFKSKYSQSGIKGRLRHFGLSDLCPCKCKSRSWQLLILFLSYPNRGNAFELLNSRSRCTTYITVALKTVSRLFSSLFYLRMRKRLHKKFIEIICLINYDCT